MRVITFIAEGAQIRYPCWTYVDNYYLLLLVMSVSVANGGYEKSPSGLTHRD